MTANQTSTLLIRVVNQLSHTLWAKYLCFLYFQIMDVFVRVLSAEKTIIHQSQTLISNDIEQPYYNSYGTLISKLKDLVKDLTFSLNLGRCDYALTIRHRGNNKNYIVPNEETYQEIRKKVVQNPTDFAILSKYGQNIKMNMF